MISSKLTNKQYDKLDWLRVFKNRGSGVEPRMIRNIRVKQAGSHPLSSSEQAALEAWLEYVPS